MKSLRKIMALVLSLALVLVMFAGCGSSEESSAASSSESSEEETAEEVVEEEPAEEESAEEEPAEAPAEEAPAEEAPAEEAPAEEPAEAPAAEAAGSGYELPLVDEETTITFWMPMNSSFDSLAESYSDNYGIQMLEERTGITIDFTSVASDVKEEQFMLMASTGTMTDLMQDVGTVYASGIVAAAENELIYDMTDLMDEYAPYYLDFINEHGYEKDVVDDDGHFYLFATMSIQDTMAQIGLTLRKDWLEETDIGTVETYDDWYEYLSYAHNTYGAQLLTTDEAQESYGYLCAGYGTKMYISTNPYDTYLLVDGEVAYGPMLKDNALEYLTMMNQWYNEGLIYDDYVTQAAPFCTDPDMIASGRISAAVTVSGYWDSLPEMSDDPDFAIWPVADPVKEAGTTHELAETQQAAGTTEGISISFTCDQVETCMKFLDYLYTDEGIELCSNGELGYTYEYDENGVPRYTDFMMNNEKYSLAEMKLLYISNIQQAKDRTIEFADYNDFENACLDVWFQNGYSDSYPKAATMTAEESSEYAAIYSDIQTYAAEAITKFINGDRPLDDYDSFMDDLVDMGIEECVQIKQAAYERYMAR